MPKQLLARVPARLLNLPKTAEWLARNVLLLGFMTLLLLVGFLGYWSRQNFDRLGQEIETIRQTEMNHTRVVRGIAETAGKMRPSVDVLIGTPESDTRQIPAKRNLEALKREMEERIADGRNTTLANTKEWIEFETAFREYWESIRRYWEGLGSAPIDYWPGKRKRMEEAITALIDVSEKEREEDDRRMRELSQRENRKLVSATLSVLGVGVVVALLTFYEIRKALKRLGKAYQESSESRDYLESLLDSLVSGVIVIGQDREVQTISESFRKLPGLQSQDPLSKNYKEVFSNNPSLVEAIDEQIDKQLKDTIYLGRVELAAARLFDVFASPLVIAEEQRGLILVFLDITETERAQSELRRNRALAAVGQMTAQIAHEIKNPLGSIRFATEVLKRQSPKREGADLETIEVIERSVDHLAAIVAELSEFARPKELNSTEINLSELLDGLVPMVADRLNTRQIHIKQNFSADLPAGHYDETELRKLFLNLIINAIDASLDGSEIELVTRQNGKREAVVEIVDHGTGMDEMTLKRLFEPFYTTKEKGTGLGMAIAKKIAELHRGDLSVKSRKGKGTTVTVRLPLS